MGQDSGDQDESVEGGCAFEMRQPFRLFKEDGSRNTDIYCPWPGGRVTWSLDNVPAGTDRAQCEAVFAHAFSVWEAASALTVSQVPAAQPCDIRIGFYSDHMFPVLIGSGGESRSAFAFDPCGKGPHKGRIIFNENRDWSNGNVSVSGAHSKLFCFAVHEVGHAIGIGTHTYSVSDVMQQDPSFWGGDLSHQDIAHITHLYPEGHANNDLFV